MVWTCDYILSVISDEYGWLDACMLVKSKIWNVLVALTVDLTDSSRNTEVFLQYQWQLKLMQL